MPSDASDVSSDAVLIQRDDISNYNPENILPKSPEAIAKIRQWLQPTAYDDHFGEYHKHLASHAAGTGIWLTSSATYREWLQGQNVGTLWVKGIPGSGKSVIAAQLVRDLAERHPGTPVLYFFFRQIIDANHSPTALLRDWLDQVLIYSPPLQHCLHEHVEALRLLDSLSMDDLWRNLRLALGGLPNNAYCVIDGLDEMDRGHDDFLRTLAALGLWKPDKVKVLMTSRPIERLETALRKAEMLHIRLDETAVDRDISTFVQQKLGATSITDSDRTLIVNAVPGRANGLFLYAKLAMDAFLKPGANVHDVLETLPQNLNDMYTNLLREHSIRSGVSFEIQRLILQCATHATRPLRLLEVAEMLELTYLSRPEKNLTETKDMVRAACGPLLEILPDETVCVVHHTYTEYLTGTTRPDTPGDYPALKPGPTHNALALACLSYLESGCLSGVKFKRSKRDSDMYFPFTHEEVILTVEVDLRLKYPFIEYAASNWHVHVAKSIQAGYNQDEVNKVLRRFFEDGDRLSAWLGLDRYWRKHDVDGATQLHVAAGLGLEQYIRDLLQMGDVNIDPQDELGRTPLWWAASSGHAGVVRLLAQAGANPDQDNNYSGIKPLHEAAKGNHAEVVRALLECGVSPLTRKTKDNPGRRCGNSRSTVGESPLKYATTYGHLEAVDAFLPFLSDPDIVRQALAWAAKSGWPTVVRRILEHPNADANAADSCGVTPLSLACSSMNEDTVLAFLNAGADPNVYPTPKSSENRFFAVRLSHHHGKNDHSPLHRLCTSAGGHDSPSDSAQNIFSLLVGAGVDIHQRYKDGSNALHWAVKSPILTRLLLDAGVDANVASSDGATPLHKAKDAEVISLLIELGGADINRTNNDGKTPLLSLLGGYSSSTEGLKKILEYGPDVSVVDNKGDSALHYLLRRFSLGSMTTVLRDLLAMGADPNRRNYSGDLPLHDVQYDHSASDQVLDLLLNAGADINAQNKKGSTFLFQIIQHRPLKMLDFAELLLEKGASLTRRDFNGRTILHEAVRTWCENAGDACLGFLLARGLDPKVIDNSGNNLLHELAMLPKNHDDYGHEARVGLWKQLVSLGLDLGQRNYEGRTPLHILCCSSPKFNTSSPSTIFPIDFVISQMAVSGAMTVDVADNAGITPLHLASTISCIYTRKLLDAGADPKRATMEGRTPLHLAAQSRASNIVGILLDALYLRQVNEDLPAGDVAKSKVTVLPTGSWYHDKAFQFSREVTDARDTFTSNRTSKPGWTPLGYACRSGRPETVELLLRAGSDVTVSNLVGACLEFEQEQSLWDREHQSGANLDTGGLLFGDTSRPSISSSQGAPDLHTQTARIDEILEMLLENGMQLDPDEVLDYNSHYHLIDTAFRNGRDYTVGCMAKARSLQSERKDAIGKHSVIDTFAEHQRRHIQETYRQSIASFKGIHKGDGNESLFVSLMMRRDYDMVKELSRAGADFFQRNMPSYRSNNFEVLVSLGFTSLAKSIINDLYTGPNESSEDAQPDRFQNVAYLTAAVRRKLPNMEMVRFLVEDCGSDINEVHGSNSPLLAAARGEQWWHAALAVPYFIERSADLNIRNDAGQTPLHIALCSGDSRSTGLFFRDDVVRALVKAGADVNAVDIRGRSCVAYATDNAALVRLLLENGAKGDAYALFAAIDSNNHDALQALLSAGVDPNMRRPESQKNIRHRDDIDEWQLFAVHHAARTSSICDWNRLSVQKKAVLQQSRAKMVEMLLAHGADPFATFLQRTTTRRSPTKWEESNTSTPESDSSPLNSPPVPKGYVRSTILHDLVESGLPVEPFLKQANIDVNHRDPSGKTLLLSACTSKKGPDVLIEIPPSGAPSSSAATSQTLLQHLLSRGADPLARDNQGRNALHQVFECATQHYYLGPSWKDALAHMADTYPALVNQRDRRGGTPLHAALRYAAAGSGGQETAAGPARTLLRAGADPLLTDGEGNSGLHLIAPDLRGADVRGLFAELLGRGCAVDARNARGETPLFVSRFSHHAPHPDDADGVREDRARATLWEAAGADFHTRDGAGRGLLHVAARGKAARFQELMQRGLDPMLEDDDKQTPLDVAAACGNKDVLALFARKKE
ncbi:putative ankyrin repeat protein [Rosellinia necatrix]|uniref:Putative ankyrin repeat protein n=1 Tax=Rosellinia necatrix TaxID=77044 RepID=A0A1W2TWT0_ROSNE|nr:putative ankyrin repeat protein [Rosellinia necatrix]